MATVHGVAGAARVNNLDSIQLTNQEKHGKRLDVSSQDRVIYPGVKPFTTTGLDLHELYQRHIKDPTTPNLLIPKTQKGTIALHMIVQFPNDLVDGEDAELMLGHAREFAESIYGQFCIFADRVDRDEEGRHVVDLFLAPKYQKETARKRQWAISVSKHGKDNAKKWRYKHYNGVTNGKAIQDQLHWYLKNVMCLEGVQRGGEKEHAGEDRKTREQHKQEVLEERETKLKDRAVELDDREAMDEGRLDYRAAELDGREAGLSTRQAELDDREAAVGDLEAKKRDLGARETALEASERTIKHRVEHATNLRDRALQDHGLVITKVDLANQEAWKIKQAAHNEAGKIRETAEREGYRDGLATAAADAKKIKDAAEAEAERIRREAEREGKRAALAAVADERRQMLEAANGEVAGIRQRAQAEGRTEGNTEARKAFDLEMAGERALIVRDRQEAAKAAREAQELSDALQVREKATGAMERGLVAIEKGEIVQAELDENGSKGFVFSKELRSDPAKLAALGREIRPAWSRLWDAAKAAAGIKEKAQIQGVAAGKTEAREILKAAEDRTVALDRREDAISAREAGIEAFESGDIVKAILGDNGEKTLKYRDSKAKETWSAKIRPAFAHVWAYVKAAVEVREIVEMANRILEPIRAHAKNTIRRWA